MKKFSDVTGLSVTEIKGLTKAGGELGVSSDDITRAIERLSVGLNEAHKGAGDLFDRVRQINPELARQLAETKGTAQGFDILAQAIKNATDAAQRNALARAAFGRGAARLDWSRRQPLTRRPCSNG
jgi:ABC-type transporter Mla subunit MlaD